MKYGRFLLLRPVYLCMYVSHDEFFFFFPDCSLLNLSRHALSEVQSDILESGGRWVQVDAEGILGQNCSSLFQLFRQLRAALIKSGLFYSHFMFEVGS